MRSVPLVLIGAAASCLSPRCATGASAAAALQPSLRLNLSETYTLDIWKGEVSPILHRTARGQLVLLQGNGSIGKPPHALLSDDQGRTWREWEAFRTWPKMAYADVVRQGDELLAFGFNNKDCYEGTYLWRSKDEGLTWTGGQRLTADTDRWAPMNNRVLVTGHGRLILPIEQLLGAEGPGPNQIGTIYSADRGRSWQRSPIFGPPPPLPDRPEGFGEPSTVELSDGRLWMVFRTRFGHLWQAWSADGGATWGTPSSTGLVSPLSAVNAKRIPGADTVIVFWNNAIPGTGADWNDANNYWRPRSPLVFAVSQDNCQTWSRPVIVDSGTAAYPSIAFSEREMLVAYWADPDPQAVYLNPKSGLMLVVYGIPSLLGYAAAAAAAPDYRFDHTVSREVLENYLARSITMMDLCTGRKDATDDIRMLHNLGAKFAGRTLYLWGGEAALPAKLATARVVVAKVREADPDMILQAGIFEIVTTQVNELAVPDWVFAEFGVPLEARNFRYEAMLFDKDQFRNHWQAGASVPDMSKLETRMWFYFLARQYIDVGMEAIHFGQVALIGARDRNLAGWRDLLGRVRAYAARSARRHLVLCDAHTPDGGPQFEGRLLFDFHAFPLRIKEVAGKPQEGMLEVGYLDSLFKRSQGGIAPSGWTCASLPYLVELDNWGSSGKAGTGGMSYWTWGYDEICWFAHQPEAYRNAWLRYASAWVREHDSSGFLQMPGSRCLADPVNGLVWYEANARGPACPNGFGQEETIRAIWAGER